MMNELENLTLDSSAPACSPSDLEVSQRREKMWRDECTRIVNALADLAELPRDPCPGWQPCIEKIKAIMANAEAHGRGTASTGDDDAHNPTR
jgi:hypothetical protein